MKKFLCSMAVLCCLSHVSSSFAVELFPGGKPETLSPNSPLPKASTANGYALYQGDENWQLVQVTTQKIAPLPEVKVEALILGMVQVRQLNPQGDWTATMLTTVTLTDAIPSPYKTGTSCSGSHLIVINKSLGPDGNCLMVDVERSTGAKPATIMKLRIAQTPKSGRMYSIDLFFNLEALGFHGTVPADWTAAAVKTVPERLAFLLRLQDWAASLQDASARAVDAKKPQDVFAGIPSYQTLVLPPAQPQVEGSFPKNFLDAVAQTRNRPGFRAFAYTQMGRQFRWQTRNGMGDQASADEQALESCDSGRPALAPPCKLYDLGAAPQ